MNKKSFFKKILAFAIAFSVLVPISAANINQTHAASNYNEHNASNRDYEWYMDQGSTGQYAGINCGPTSSSMVMKWINKNSTDTGEILRNIEPNGGNWWSTNIIESYFRYRGVNYSRYTYSEYTLLSTIKRGGIALVCLDMSKISRNHSPKESKIGRFYDNVTGHFIVIKGYEYIQGELYFEAYDPFSMGLKYDNGEYLGKDRLYKASELSNAINSWWRTIYTFR